MYGIHAIMKIRKVLAKYRSSFKKFLSAEKCELCDERKTHAANQKVTSKKRKQNESNQ